MKIVREADGGSCDLRRSELNSGGWVFTSAEVLLVPKKLFNCKWSTKNEKKSGFWRSGASLRILTCFFCFYCFYFVFICCYFVFICFYFVFICLYLFLLFLFVFICFYFVVICFYLFSLFPPPPKICSGRGRRFFAHVLGNINSLVPRKASQEVES